MKLIYLDSTKKLPADHLYDTLCRTDEEVITYIRHQYRRGTMTFYIDYPPGTTILNQLATLRNSGRFKHLKLRLHCHGDIIDHRFMEENKNWVIYYD